MTDLVIRGGTLVASSGRRRADVAIEGGSIVEVAPELPGGRAEIDASGLFVLPGIIDVHLHFNEPGRTEWEGAATGSRALAAGGGTLFFDMPLNSTPCTVNARRIRSQAGGARGLVDHRLRTVGRPGARLDLGHGGAGRAGGRGLQGIHVRLGPAGVPARRRRNTDRGDAGSRAARPAGCRARRKRGNHTGRHRRGARDGESATSWRRGPSPRSSKRSSAR